MKLLSSSLSDALISQQNPLRGLNMGKVVSELEFGQRGDYSHLQWLYHFIEKRDATLRGAKRRILSALLKLDWDIKVRADLSKRDTSLAEKQKAHLKGSYGQMKGMRRALKHFAMAEFRGFAHVEKHFDVAGNVIGLEPVPQWHWCRDGIYGDWQFQADALRGGINGEQIKRDNFIIREVEDPINEIAVIAFTRKGLSSKDFDAFVARYGIPFVYWILSEQMASALATDSTKMAEWMALMRGIGSDGEGIFPGGEIETLDSGGSGKDNNPFLQHLGYQDEQIVMAATSGKLTMLNDPAGMGGSNSSVHQDTFDDIALALAMEISETFHEQLDIPELARAFPGQRPLVYFCLAAKDAEDVGQLVKDAKTLDEAGWEMDTAQLSEKTGYKITRKATTNTKDNSTARPANEGKEDAPAGEDPAGADKGPVKPGAALKAPAQKNRAKNAKAGSPRRRVAQELLAGFDTLAATLLAESNDELTAVLADALTDNPKDSE